MLTVLCYHWECGAYLSGAELTTSMFGDPTRITRSIHSA